MVTNQRFVTIKHSIKISTGRKGVLTLIRVVSAFKHIQLSNAYKSLKSDKFEKSEKWGGGRIALAHSFWILAGGWAGPGRGLLRSDHECAPWVRGLKGFNSYPRRLRLQTHTVIKRV